MRFVTFNLGSAFSFDHGTNETIVLSQGGARLFTSGTVVLVPASDLSAQIDFTLDADATVLDGESDIEDISVTVKPSGFFLSKLIIKSLFIETTFSSDLTTLLSNIA